METHIIILLNILSAVTVMVAAIVVFFRFFRNRISHISLLILAFVILFIISTINILDYMRVLKSAEEFEQIFSVLFIPVLIFSIHSRIIRSELNLRLHSEQKFKGIFDQTFSFIGLLDKTGRVLEANSTACQFVGYETDEYKGQLFADTKWWKHSVEERARIIYSISKAAEGETVRLETFHLDKNGNKIHVDFTIKPVYDNNGDIIYLIPEGRDITETKLARLQLEMHKANLEDIIGAKTRELQFANDELQVINEELKATNEELHDKNITIKEQNEELNNTLQHLKETQNQLIQSEKMASLGILTAGVSHEINNPLNYITGGYIGLERYLKKHNMLNENEIAIFIEAIKEGTERAAKIVKGLNQFSNNTDKFIEDCYIHDILDNCILMLESKLRDRISVTKKYSPVNIYTVGNIAALHTMFTNIIINAIQAIESKGAITIESMVKDKNASIAIADSGSGITDEVLPKVLDPFFTTKPAGSGTGLGLSIAHTIVQEHKGTINIESKVNKGTVVIVTLPVI